MIYTVTFNPSLDYLMSVEPFTLGKTNRSSEEEMTVGGKGINVSIVLDHLELPSNLIAYIGGFTGHHVAKQLEHFPYITKHLLEADGQTRINVKIKGEQETEINAQGITLLPSHIEKLSKLFETLSTDDIVVISGSFAKGMEKESFISLLKILQKRHVRFVLDISDPVIIDAIKLHPMMIKPNIDELALFFEKNHLEADEILQYGIELAKDVEYVLLSQGADGALLFHGNDIYQADVPDGTLINSVGAGDSMVAGFVFAFYHKMVIEDLFRLAVSCGSATAYSKGLAEKKLVMELYDGIEVTKIK